VRIASWGKIRIFDTTLRDGDQMAGVELSLEDKIEIARALDELSVDIIEAGFPASSEIDFKTIRILSKEISSSKLAALSRATKKDVDEAAASEACIIHVFIATSDIHLKYKLKTSRDEILNKIAEIIEYAREYTPTVLFSAEDGTRSDRKFLLQAYREAIKAGARYINVPDTVGTSTPWRFYDLITYLRSNLPQDVWIDVHCHNDFGMATANTLAGINAGADGAQVTINGFGERAGNAALEEVVSALHFLMGEKTNIRLEMLTKVSKLVADKFGIKLQPNKAIVGLNAFAHEAGIHVHGVLENPSTYEVMRPEDVGNSRRIVLGRHSGRYAVTWTLQEMGINPPRKLVDYILYKLKEIAPRTKKVTEEHVWSWVKEFKSRSDLT